MEREQLPAPSLERERAEIIELLCGASLEVSAQDPLAGDALRDVVPPLATIYINYAPSDNHHGIVAAAARLKRAGFDPVPHVAARTLASFTQLNDYLLRLTGEAGVADALVIAGDLERPVGPFECSLQILATGLLEKHGIRRFGIAGYPDGHPRIARARLDAALTAKAALARERGLVLRIVTQFGFDAGSILSWIRDCRARGIDAPIHVGLAGPASLSTLVKFAVRCGVGDSLRALANGQASLTRLLTEAGPEPVIRHLAARQDLRRDIAGLHLFTFGGIRRTATWLAAIRSGAFAMNGDRGFRVAG
jgi:methylenetetrahydrofolate reductase (NADPH)